MESRKLPHSTLIIVLGALSIVGCCMYNIGLIIGLVALYLAMKATDIYKQDPQAYDDYSNVTIGKVLAIIGIVINVLSLLFFIWAVTKFGWDVVNDKVLFQQVFLDYLGVEQP